jgi:cation diffusion facilitator family transporter
MSGGTAHIKQSLLSNALIGVAKGVAAFITGSGAMVAETIHSFADCGNQLLLLLGVSQSRKGPDATHPLGQGRALYFWSFMVALLLFAGGGMFSIYEGVHKLQHPEKVGDVTVALIVLGVAIVLEGWATISNIRELNRRRNGRPFFRFLRLSKDSDLVVVFGENAAATVGLVLAFAAVLISKQTNDGRWDAIGTLAIGGVLVLVALFLAAEIKSLLMGESADPDIAKAIQDLVGMDPSIEKVLLLITIQQGPGEVLIAMKLKFKADLTTAELCHVVNTLEEQIRLMIPEAKWIFVEPDVVE